VEKTTERGALCSVLNKYYLGDIIKKGEIGRAYSTYGKQERYIQGFGAETCWKETTGRPGRRWEYNIKMDIEEVEWGMDWIDVAQDRDRWWALVNAVMNLGIP
jgi:hypothetical protein